MLKKACHACSTIILVLLTNNITAFWRCCCRSRRRFLNSLLLLTTANFRKGPIYWRHSEIKHHPVKRFHVFRFLFFVMLGGYITDEYLKTLITRARCKGSSFPRAIQMCVRVS